jgi:hypothetical protein
MPTESPHYLAFCCNTQFDNCYAYNDEFSEVTEEAARLFGLLPEAFAEAAVAVAKKSTSK